MSTRARGAVTARPRPLRGTVTVPGDKSISHRAVLFGGLARGSSIVRRVNLGRDLLATCRAVRHLGATCRVDARAAIVEVSSEGWDALREPDTVIDAGNSGTTIRALMGVCATVPGATALTGDRTLRRRPMARVAAPLRAMGATVDGRAGGDLPPLWVRGGRLTAIEWTSPVASAQVKTAVLVAGLRARGSTAVTEPAPSRDHTERMLTAAGVRVRRSRNRVEVDGGQEPAAIDLAVPGDPSAAAFLVTLACLVPGSDLTVAGIGLNPTRTGFLTALRRMGADVVAREEEVEAGEPRGSVRARGGDFQAIEVAGDIIPSLIDEIPVLAVAATQARGTTVFRDAGELRVKESDRVEVLVRNLTRLGAKAEALPDGLAVTGPTPLRAGTVEARGDHRIALAFAVAAAASGRDIRVRGWQTVRTSFPEWEATLAAARGGR